MSIPTPPPTLLRGVRNASDFPHLSSIAIRGSVRLPWPALGLAAPVNFPPAAAYLASLEKPARVRLPLILPRCICAWHIPSDPRCKQSIWRPCHRSKHPVLATPHTRRRRVTTRRRRSPIAIAPPRIDNSPAGCQRRLCSVQCALGAWGTSAVLA